MGIANGIVSKSKSMLNFYCLIIELERGGGFPYSNLFTSLSLFTNLKIQLQPKSTSLRFFSWTFFPLLENYLVRLCIYMIMRSCLSVYPLICSSVHLFGGFNSVNSESKVIKNCVYKAHYRMTSSFDHFCWLINFKRNK